MISIIVPVYNIVNCVEACIKSILAQRSPHWEMILVDDGSTDGSGEICQTYAESDRRIKYVHKTNGGLSSARNAGIEIARGDWIMFVDGDDCILPDTVDTLLRVIPNTDNADVIHFGFQEIKLGDVELISYAHSDNVHIVDNKKEMFIYLNTIGGEAASACTKLIRRSLLDSLCFKEGILHEDEEFTPRLLIKANKIAYVDFKPYIYIQRPGSIITSRFNSKRLDILDIMNARFSLMLENNLDSLVPVFRLRFLRMLTTMYMVAYAARDYDSAEKIRKEHLTQIKRLDFSKVHLQLSESLRYRITQLGVPVLKIEARVRKFLNKEIK